MDALAEQGSRGWRPRLELLLAPILVAILGLPLVIRLASFPESQPLREWLIEEPSAAASRPVDLAYSGRSAGADILQLRIRAANIRDLAASSEIELLFATHATHPTLLEATLQVEGTSCVFRSPPHAVIQNNALLRFEPRGACREFDGFPTGDLFLDVRIEMASGRVALWTFEHERDIPRLFVMSGPLTLAVRGLRVTTPRTLTRNRIALLAHLWNVTPNVLWARLRGIGVVVFAGVLLLVWRTPPSATRRWQIARATAGAALLMTGLALAHAILFPPLQAPDEPDHLLSLAARHGDAAMAAETEALARKTHFQRIRHNAEQHFREVDIMRPWPVAWDEEIRVELVGRSPLTEWWWDLVGMRHGQSVPHLLWQLRRANAVFFGLAAGLAVCVMSLTMTTATAAALILALLAVPTLPFFGAHFSDTAVIVAVSLLVAASIAGLVIEGGPTHWLGVPLGASLVLTLLAGRRMWPLLPAIAAVLVAHALTSRQPRRTATQFLVFWGSVAALFAIALWSAERAGVLAYGTELVSTRFPEALRPIAAPIVARLWLAAGIPLLLGVVDWITDRMKWQSPLMRHVATAIAIACAAWLAVGLASSWFVAYATTPQIISGGDDPVAYVRRVFATMAVPFRIGHHDQLLSLLFWGGLGWVDTSPPEWVINLVITATAGVAVWALLQSARAGAGRVMRIVALVAGLAASLAVFAIGSFSLTYALYGRYLIGWYLLIVMTVWTAVALSRKPWWPWLVAAFIAHAYYLQLVPLRYF